MQALLSDFSVPHFKSLLSSAFKDLPRGFLISILIHLILFVILYAALFVDLPQPESDPISVQIYSSANLEGSGTGKGKGSKRPALKKAASSSDEFSNVTGKNQSGRDGVADGFEDGKGADWGTADDPTLDGGSRYAATIEVTSDPNDYPASARDATIGNVTVAVSVLISSAGKISDCRIRYVRAQNGQIGVFKQAFEQSACNLFLHRARLRNAPYSKDGRAVSFKWDTAITFTLN